MTVVLVSLFNYNTHSVFIDILQELRLKLKKKKSAKMDAYNAIKKKKKTQTSNVLCSVLGFTFGEKHINLFMYH